jgi:hypothetical protein
MKTGFITCNLCGSRVKTSDFNYGGLARLVCVNELCNNSETSFKVGE